MQEQPHSDRKESDTAHESAPEPRNSKQKRARPKRPLPTSRVTFPKQLRCLVSYGLESRDGKASVGIAAVGKAVELHPSTVSLCNPFFVDAGFLSKTGRGAFMPSTEVLAMARAHEWNPDTAVEKLLPQLRDLWAVQALEPRLRLHPIDFDDAIQILAEGVGAGPTHKVQLSIVLEYLCAAGVIRREGHQVSWVPASPSTEPRELPEPEPEEEQVTSTADNEPRETVPERTSGIGGVSFTVSIQVATEEISRWSPERITAFFGGLAQVLAAQRNGGGDDRRK